MTDKSLATKRVQLSQAQQTTLLEVLVASLLVGAAIVLSIWLVRTINFNTQVIAAKDEAISSYKTTLQNVSALNGEIMNNLAKNVNLEAVAKDMPECQGVNATKDLSTVRLCSALRVIPDALPASNNVEATMASLNQIFTLSGWTPESLAPGDSSTNSGSGLGEIPVSLSVESDSATVIRVLNNVEKSIRNFQISTASIEWSGDNRITLSAKATAYFTSEKALHEKDATVDGDGKVTVTTTTGGQQE